MLGNLSAEGRIVNATAGLSMGGGHAAGRSAALAGNGRDRDEDMAGRASRRPDEQPADFLGFFQTALTAPNTTQPSPADPPSGVSAGKSSANAPGVRPPSEGDQAPSANEATAAAGERQAQAQDGPGGEPLAILPEAANHGIAPSTDSQQPLAVVPVPADPQASVPSTEPLVPTELPAAPTSTGALPASPAPVSSSSAADLASSASAGKGHGPVVSDGLREMVPPGVRQDFAAPPPESSGGRPPVPSAPSVPSAALPVSAGNTGNVVLPPGQPGTAAVIAPSPPPAELPGEVLAPAVPVRQPVDVQPSPPAEFQGLTEHLVQRRIQAAIAQGPNAAVLAGEVEVNGPPRPERQSKQGSLAAASDPVIAADFRPALAGEMVKVQGPTVAGQIGEAILGQMEVLARTGRTEVRIRLDPPELGRVDIRITATEHSLDARLVVHEGTARQLIEGQVQFLKARLAEAGIQLGSCDVSGGGRQGHGSGQRPWEEDSGFAGTGGADFASATTAGVPWLRLGRIDAIA